MNGKKIVSAVVLIFVLALIVYGCGDNNGGAQANAPSPRNVIFFHPDGYGFSHWNTLRFYLKGPDGGLLNWDKLPHMAPYKEHMKDALTASSHGGATVHAYGVKVVKDSFGKDGINEITALSGKKASIMEEAVEAGFATALIQTGAIYEPGTAAFVASVDNRRNYEDIALQVIESRVDVILSGGESWLLPTGVQGKHGVGSRTDGRDLISRARELGYTVVYNRDELIAAANDTRVSKLLGVFAHDHTFNDRPEEELRARGLLLYVAGSPTIAEMSDATLKILSRNPKARTKGIFIVAEEEGTDNFGNVANAIGSLEAGRRADEAFGVFWDFVNKNPNTLLITAADSSAGGMSLLGPVTLSNPLGDADINSISKVSKPYFEYVKAPLDGTDGAYTAPYYAPADRNGVRLPFAITWATLNDLSGGILARAIGLNAQKVTELGVIDNTDIYRIKYYTLFDRWLK